jgi:hypothetical protein
MIIFPSPPLVFLETYHGFAYFLVTWKGFDPDFSSKVPSRISPPRYATDYLIILVLAPISQDTNLVPVKPKMNLPAASYGVSEE